MYPAWSSASLSEAAANTTIDGSACAAQLATGTAARPARTPRLEIRPLSSASTPHLRTQLERPGRQQLILTGKVQSLAAASAPCVDVLFQVVDQETFGGGQARVEP